MGREELQVELGERAYPILIGALAESAERAAELWRGRRVFLVADGNTARFAPSVAALLAASGAAEVVATDFPAGEASKTFDTAAALCREAARRNFDRRALFAALGGGVVGDLTGFAAAIYLRGVDFLQIPTSLLAMIDSSVGGKTGVDLPEGKNLAGAFHQPEAVLIDPAFLATLPGRERRSALAEAVKYGVIADAALFDRLETAVARLLDDDIDAALYGGIIRRCCEIKAEIVAGDEREQAGGRRALLNYGHTFGHAVELCSGYRLNHGEAVAVGLALAGELAVRTGDWRAADRDRQAALLARLGLPTAPPAGLPVAGLLAAMGRDKKARGGVPVFVLPQKIGAAAFRDGVARCELETLLREYCS